MRRNMHLVCNAHLDPVWLWRWEEGAAEALSTFRVAADFCEANEGFVFNHNEVILYQWVEEYDSELFARIVRLVKAGRWHIMGGWYLQPDCNMPSGESFVRQMLAGRRYFREKFGVAPTTAINFDSFGHNRGLVQLMKKAGYDSYVFCRPEQKNCPLPEENFTWVGYDGSEIACHRGFNSYESHRGKVDRKILRYIDARGEEPAGLVLWGIGDHGGGPSRVDYGLIQTLSASRDDYALLDSTPEAYFKELRETGRALPKFERSLEPHSVGCYTAQARIKKLHRGLENEIYLTEKMASIAAITGAMAYPESELREAQKDLMFLQFHDILPGSSIQPVEEDSIRLASHGLEIMSRAKTRAFFALLKDQMAAADGEIPIFLYNPFPYAVKGVFECEFQLADQNWTDEYSFPAIHQDGKRIPCQTEHEDSNFNIDWRKRSVFFAELPPFRVSRFDARIQMLPRKGERALREENGKIRFVTELMDLTIDCATGLVESYSVGGFEYLKPGAFQALVMEDSENSWGNDRLSFSDLDFAFRLMTREESAAHSGITDGMPDPVRVIEDGEARAVVEALFCGGGSSLRMRYKLSRHSSEFQVDLDVHWNEKMRMLKLQVPVALSEPEYLGQGVFGVERLATDGFEMVSQKWNAVASRIEDRALSCVNDGSYGSDFKDGMLRLSLLRSPGYSAGCSDFHIRDPKIMPQDRCSSFMDLGERNFSFWFDAGPLSERLARVGREAQAHNEKPFILSFFPSGKGDSASSFAMLDDETVELSAFKKCEGSEDYVLRFFEPTGKGASTLLRIPSLGIEYRLDLGSFEVRTLRLLPREGRLVECGLMEEEIE
jgi:alpha-mannosidase